MAKKRANGEGNIRKRKDGRWEGRYTVGYDEKAGKRITKSVLGRTQAEVKEKLAKAVTEAEHIDVRRAEIRAKKRALTEEQIVRYSEELAQKLFVHPLYQAAKSIYGYMSYNQEVRTMPILRQAQADGKRVAVPKVYGDEMKFLWLDDLNRTVSGAYSIPEPVGDEPEAADETALILMPGLAFDPAGHRCGYGGGFYDKYLAAHKNHPTIALCYGFQMYDHLDVDEFDIPVDAVIAAEEDAE